MTVLVDSNVLIDVLSEASTWSDWSSAQLLHWAERGPLLFNDLIYAEVSVGFDRQLDLDGVLRELGLDHIAVSPEALFAAGKAFRAYRRSEGQRFLRSFPTSSSEPTPTS